MRNGERDQTGQDQSVGDAKNAANNIVRTRLMDAQDKERRGQHPEAMKQLGRAMHTLQDSTSPAHHGFQPWFNYRGGGANWHEWAHAGKEGIDPGYGSWLYEATLEAYQYFKGTKPMQADFFQDLGVDSVEEQLKGRTRIWMLGATGEYRDNSSSRSHFDSGEMDLAF
jgi:hypothetical protein